jgi:hypothetical protein
VRAACKRAKIERSTAYKARKEDDGFAAAWKAALDDAIDSLEAEAWRRARDGTKRLVLYKGEPVLIKDKPLIEREYSDALMTLLLKAHRPERFAERQRHENVNLDLSTLNDQQLELLAGGASLAAVFAAASESGAGETQAD